MGASPSFVQLLGAMCVIPILVLTIFKQWHQKQRQKHTQKEQEREREMEHQREKIEQLGDDGLVPSYSSSSPLCQCRICHEEEEEESTTMESPCACCGTLKFAHRGCIQRWCDEKGNTVCEICQHKFELGYTVPPKASQLVDVMVTIRGSLEVPRLDYEPHSGASDDDESDNDDPECSAEAERGSSSYRSVALMVTAMLLIGHLIAITTGSDHYAFSLSTVFLLRASGILLPFYLIMHMIAGIQRSQWQHRMRELRRQQREALMARGEDDLDPDQHRIQINS